METNGESVPPFVQVQSWGLTVGPFGLPNEGLLFAEIEPAPLWNWRPWRGRTSRWWYEIKSASPREPWQTTWAYQPGGSGGGFTLRACVRRARRAMHDFQEAEEAAHFGRTVPS